MYARVVRGQTAPDRLDQFDAVVRSVLVAALREQRGFSGALSLLDRETGGTLLVILWETEEQAARPMSACDGSFLEALLTVAALSTEGPDMSTVWEISARG
jgi:hypothetical protein